MSGTSLSSIAGALKNVYDDYVERMQNTKHRAIDEISKSLAKYNPGGNGFYGAINDYGNEAVGAINETEAFRTADNENYAQWKVTPKIMNAPVRFSGLVAAAASADEQAFVGVVVDALDRAKERLLKDENRQFYGMGTGHLCYPAASIASNLTSFTVDTVQYLRENALIDICASNGSSTQVTTGIRITAIDHVNNIMYLNVSVGTALTAGNDFVKQNIRVSQAADGKEFMGLRGIVDDGTDVTTFQSLSVSGNFLWQARRISNTGNLTSDLLQQLIDDVAVLSGEEPDKLIMHRRQRRKYLDIVVPQKRYADGDMDTGFQKLQFNGMELWLDYDCQIDTVYALKLDRIRKFELEALGMGKYDGSDTFLRLSGQDQFEAYWRHYCNFGTSQRNSLGKITGLATPSGAA